MRARSDTFLEGLVALERHDVPSVRTAVFRQSVASLSIAATGEGAGPLDAVNPDDLARSIRVALADGLLDDLSWLAAPAAAVALYEIGGALPIGAERREVGRRILAQLYAGNAKTFLALATRMAAGSARGLSGSAFRARLALVLAAPSSADLHDGPLALTLISRRELASDWLGALSIGSLPDRRLAARLLERGAREAACRAASGDDAALQTFRRAFRGEVRTSSATLEARNSFAMFKALPPEADPVARAFRKLLADRETLVWRYVACARGLLASTMTEAATEITLLLDPNLSPTEWRRGATSLVASVAGSPDRALPLVRELLEGPLLKRDPGIATAMLWGVARVADVEPEAAEELLDAIARAAPLFIAEALVELRRDVQGIGDRAAARCAEALGATLDNVSEEEVLALARALLDELRGREMPLRRTLREAVDAFIEIGTREAHARAERALTVATDMVTKLEGVALDERGWPTTDETCAAAAIGVRELDLELLESGTLKNLLLLHRRPSQADSGVGATDELDERLARWLTLIESVPELGVEAPEHATQHQRQLRALLHLIDGGTTDTEGDPELRARVHERWAKTARSLLRRLSKEHSTALRRPIAATVARALDALVREGAVDPADVLLYAAGRAADPSDLAVLGEASMHPDVSQLLEAYARFARAAKRDFDGTAGGKRTRSLSAPSKDDAESEPQSPESDASRAASSLSALDAFVAELPAGASQRTEAVRAALSRLSRALSAILAADAVRPLTSADTSPLLAFEDGLSRLTLLCASAARRCGDDPGEGALGNGSTYPLTLAAGRALQPGASASQELGPSIDASLAVARAELPSVLASIIERVLPRIAELPIDPRDSAPTARASRSSGPPTSHLDARLPAWLPSRRTLGGFFVHRQLGNGAAGTVFVVTRAEERHDANAERFALKVPDYDATAARSLSETEFLKLFRQEAGALLSVPEHDNLARFVTFDAGARPKPILVMELVEGVQLDELLASRVLTMEGAMSLLDGVLAGLDAMHGVGVGHLDLKPSNVILRGEPGATQPPAEHGTESTGAVHVPVLVDFGLAGRHLRPGCGTGCYGAPEVWGIAPTGVTPTPLTADVYSFGCFAYEVLTGATLFDAESEIALVSAHLTHDGMPGPVKRLANTHGSLAEFLHRSLRRNPKDRPTVQALRTEFGRVRRDLRRITWPIAT